MPTRRTLAVALVVAGLALGSGCGKAAEKVGEKAAERAAGDGSKVDIDGGKVKVTDKDGNTIEANSDGSGKISGKDGNQTYDVGAGTELPDGWPANLDPPAGTKLTSAITNSSGSSPGMNVTGTIDAPAKDVYDGLKQQLTDGGYEIDSDTFSDAGGATGGVLSAKDDTWTVAASVSADPTGGGTVISIVLTKPAA